MHPREAAIGRGQNIIVYQLVKCALDTQRIHGLAARNFASESSLCIQLCIPRARVMAIALVYTCNIDLSEFRKIVQ